MFKLLALACLFGVCHGRWTDFRLSCIMGSNEKELADVDLPENCRQMCKAETEFVCTSIEYSIKTLKCILSSSNRATQPETVTDPCFVDPSDWLYSERLSRIWTAPRKACIRGFNDAEQTDVATIGDCAELCEEATGLRCLSIDYNANTQTCIMSNANSLTVGQDFTAPCFVEEEDWDYMERRQRLF